MARAVHFLHLIHSFSLCEYDSSFFERGSAVGKSILDYQIFAFLGVHEGRNISVFGGHHGIQPFHAVGGQKLFHPGIGSGGDFVDHGPGKGDFCRINYVIQKALICQSVFATGLGEGRG